MGVWVGERASWLCLDEPDNKGLAARSPTSTTTTSTTIIFIVAAPAAACPLPTLAGVGGRGVGGWSPRRCLRLLTPRCRSSSYPTPSGGSSTPASPSFSSAARRVSDTAGAASLLLRLLLRR
ncbi:unnamed protein product [Lampetra planeri]